MQHNDSIMVIRRTQEKDPDTHIAKTPSISNFGPYSGRLGRVTGNLTQGDPNNLNLQSLRIYIPNPNANIQNGDILVLNETKKYIVDNVYVPNRHHVEADVRFEGDI